MARAENVAAAGASYASVLVRGVAGGIGRTVTASTGGGGRGAHAGPGRPRSMEGGGGREVGDERMCCVVLRVVGGGTGRAREWWQGECAGGGDGGRVLGGGGWGLVLRLRIHLVDVNGLVVTSDCPRRGRGTWGGGGRHCWWPGCQRCGALVR